MNTIKIITAYGDEYFSLNDDKKFVGGNSLNSNSNTFKSNSVQSNMSPNPSTPPPFSSFKRSLSQSDYETPKSRTDFSSFGQNQFTSQYSPLPSSSPFSGFNNFTPNTMEAFNILNKVFEQTPVLHP